MTTRVIILCPENNHLDVAVRVHNRHMASNVSYQLTHGQSKELVVYDGQILEITEVARATTQVPA